MTTQRTHRLQTTSTLSRRDAIILGGTVAAGVALAPAALAEGGKRKVVVWSEGTANVDEKSKIVYPQDVRAGRS